MPDMRAVHNCCFANKAVIDIAAVDTYFVVADTIPIVVGIAATAVETIDSAGTTSPCLNSMVGPTNALVVVEVAAAPSYYKYCYQHSLH